MFRAADRETVGGNFRRIRAAGASRRRKPAAMYAEDELLPISSLAQYAYCPRRAGLIFVERQWADNVFTVQGRHLHERVHQPSKTRSEGRRIVRSLVLSSARLGLFGIADMVEFPDEDPITDVTIIEFKRGKLTPRRKLEYEIQLCAQAMCLEEMLGLQLRRGSLFFALSHRRIEIQFTVELRQSVESVALRMHEMMQNAAVPRPQLGRKCRGCSLRDLCMPELSVGRDAAAYLRRIVNKDASLPPESKTTEQ